MFNEMWLKPEELVTKADASDCRLWENARERHEAVVEAFPDRASAVVGADLFNTLFQGRPQIRTDAPDTIRGKFLEQTMETADFMRLHASTAFNHDLSAGASIFMKERLQSDPATQELARVMDKEESLLEALKALTELAQTVSEGSEEADKVADMTEKMGQELVGLMDQVGGPLSDGTTVQGLRRVMKETADDVQGAVDMAAGWGREPGNLERFMFDPNLRKHLGSDKIRKILDLAGKMQDVVSGQRAKRPRKGPQRIDIEFGNDLARVVPAELGMLNDPVLEDLFLRRFAEGGLQMYRYDERPRQSKGPFIVCVDESGSMQGAKEQWAKALTHALCAQAHVEKRAFGAVAFATKSEIRTIFEPTPETFIDWLGSFFNGAGTDFEMPLFHAFGMVEKDLPNADVIFITDGECDISEDFRQRVAESKKHLNVKVIGIMIGQYKLEPMKKFCDTVFRVLADTGLNGDKLEAIVQEMK